MRAVFDKLSPFVSKKPTDQGWHTVRFDAIAGLVSACNGIDGCHVPASVGFTGIASFHDLKRVVSKASDATFSMPTPTAIVVQDAATTFRFKTLPSRAVASLPEPPPDGWHTVSAEVIEALQGAVEVSEASPDPAGVRLQKSWAGGATGQMGLVVETDAFGWLDKGVTVSTSIIKSLSGEQQVAKAFSRIWFTDSDGVIRWTTPLANTYPDSLGDTLVPDAVADATRLHLSASVAEISEMFAQAKLMSSADSQARLVVEDGTLHMDGKFERGDFRSAVDCATEPDAASAPGGISVGFGDRILAALRRSGVEDDIRVSMTHRIAPIAGSVPCQREAYVFKASGGVSAILMPSLL